MQQHNRHLELQGASVDVVAAAVVVDDNNV